MNPIEVLYTCSASVAVLASIPQVRQLLVTKSSDELNIATWSLWLGTQFISLTYAISLQVHLLIIVNCIWITFYTVMLTLILYYRRNPGKVIDNACISPAFENALVTSDESA